MQEPIVLRQILTDAEVRHFNLVVFSTQQDVLGFQVSVDHLLFMNVIESSADLDEEFDESLLRQLYSLTNSCEVSR